MIRRTVRFVLVALAAIAASAFGPAGCLYSTDEDPEDAGFLGADTLGLDLIPGFEAEGMDPAEDTDFDDGDNPFAPYDCENADIDDDICEYYICLVEVSWNALEESCGQGDLSSNYCATYFWCITEYIHCIEDHCDSQSGIDSEDMNQCVEDYTDCINDIYY